MKNIGLIGGMSWESTLEYYRIINQSVRDRLGGQHSGQIVLVSLNFAEIYTMQNQGRWDDMAKILMDAARKLEKAGADFFLICTNTMHKVALEVEQSVGIPIVHIADPTGKAIQASGISKVGLLGTRFTMEHDFLKNKWHQDYGIEVIVPDPADTNTVDTIIFNELCQGNVLSSSRHEYTRIIARLRQKGAEGLILGCTEIPMLISARDTSLPLFDTTKLHAQMAVNLALA